MVTFPPDMLFWMCLVMLLPLLASYSLSCSALEIHLSGLHHDSDNLLVSSPVLQSDSAWCPPKLNVTDPNTSTWLQVLREPLECNIHKMLWCIIFLLPLPSPASPLPSYLLFDGVSLTGKREKKNWVYHGVDLTLYEFCVPDMGKRLYFNPLQPHEKVFLHSFQPDFGLGFGSLYFV